MAAGSSREKWPTEFRVVKVPATFLGEELPFYFLSGVLNRNQYKQVQQIINVLSVHEIEADKLMISTLLDRKRLNEICAVFEPRSRGWRGQYYSLANAIVDACKDVPARESG